MFIVPYDVPFALLLSGVERSDENRQRGRFKRINKIRERKLKEKKIFDPDMKQRCELFETSRRGKAVCIFRLLRFWFLFSPFFFFFVNLLSLSNENSVDFVVLSVNQEL